MTRLPERLPAALSERISGATGAVFSRFGREVDVAIGGIPFMLATSSDIPQSIETVEVRKDQFDTEVDPGEQSLAGWWRRSQSSFHEGAGFKYEPNATDKPHNGFWDSAGVNVFTPGQLTLLKKMFPLGITGTDVAMTRMRTYATGGIRINLTPNPSAEVDLTGWTGGSTTISRDTSRSFVGSACVKSVATGGATAIVRSPVAAAVVGTTYTASCHIYVPSGHPDVRMAVDGLNNPFDAVISTKDQWVRVDKTEPATHDHPAVQVWSASPASAGDTFYVDAVMIEEGAVLGPYFDGDSANAAWNGVADLSTSTETTPLSAASLTTIGAGALYKSATDGDPTSDLESLHAPAGKTLVDGMISGTSFYSVASDGTLYQGLVSAPAGATTWPCGTTPSRIMWGKHRLWMIGGRKLWQPDVNAAGGTAQNPIFTHPNQGWTYTCMAEGPSAMYFGGHDGFGSSIQAITFDSGGGIPTLSGATVTAVLPDGELVQELAVVAGQYVGIGTTQGFRIGVVNEDASITYGPLIIEPEGITACTSMTTQGRFFVVGFRTSGGEALVYRVDTGTEIDGNGVFAYAKDASCDGMIGNVTSVATIGDQVYCTTQDGRPWYQSSTELVSEGWVESSRIRFRTTELKNYKFLNVEVEPLSGDMSFDLILEGGSTLPLGNITAQGEVFDAPFSMTVAPMKYASVKITMTQNATGEDPTFLSFLLRALPAVKPQRLITLPLLCLDKERARSGMTYGGKGYARNRLQALQILEDAAETLIYQDFSDSSGSGQFVTIDSIRFIQTSPPAPHRDEGGGGILILQLRTADA